MGGFNARPSSQLVKNMYNHLLVLRFENAGIFSKYWKEKDGVKQSANKDDRVLDGKKREMRTADQWIDQKTGTFHYSFIENVIRVLVGQRPVSKYRNTCVEKDESIEEIAKRSLIKIDSLTTKDKNNQDIYVKEKITTRKALDNSWSPETTPSWTRFKYLLPETLYNKLVEVANDICKTKAKDMLFDKVADILFESKDPRVDDLVKEARDNKAEPLAKLLTGSKIHSLQQAGYIGLGPYLKTLVTKGVSDISRLDGSICIPLSSDELELFRKGNGHASLFDGGLVLIKDIIDLRYTTMEMVTSEYQKVQQ